MSGHRLGKSSFIEAEWQGPIQSARLAVGGAYSYVERDRLKQSNNSSARVRGEDQKGGKSLQPRKCHYSDRYLKERHLIGTGRRSSINQRWTRGTKGGKRSTLWKEITVWARRVGEKEYSFSFPNKGRGIGPPRKNRKQVGTLTGKTGGG